MRSKGLMSICLGMACLLIAANASAEPPKGVLAVPGGLAAPPLRVTGTDGQPVDLAKFHGRWVMLHFWASWCRPCRREMPTIQSLSKHPVGQRLTLLLVNTAESEEKIFEFLPVVAPDLESLRDPDGTITEQWAPRGLPSTFLIDPTGTIRYVALGGRVWDSEAFLTFLDQLLPPAQGQKTP